MEDTIEALLAGVRAFPRDNARKLIVADAIEEDGDLVTADAFRWAAKHNRHPKQDGSHWRWLPYWPKFKEKKRFHIYHLFFKVGKNEISENGWIGLAGPYSDLFSVFASLGKALAVLRKEVM